MTIKRFLEQRLAAAMEAAGAPAGAAAMVGPATRPEFGDYQCNGVMSAARQVRANPRALAQAVLQVVDLGDAAESLEIAGPGFINIRLSTAWLARRLQQTLDDERLGVRRVVAEQTVVVDYSHPNLAKEMHVGHLRSTIIGDALVRTLEFLGHRVVRQNHVGDWGTQFGMLIAHMDTVEQAATADLSGQLADLEQFYRQAKRRFDDEPGFADTARQYVVRLQAGDGHCRRVWQRFIEESMRHCEEVYGRLGVTLQRRDVRPESAYNDDLPTVIEDLQAQGLLSTSEGARCVFLEEFRAKDGEITPVIVQKSDGGYLYATTDLAAIRYRARHLHADRVLYVVDARQTLHLQQVFAVARAAHFAPAACALEHHPFGIMLGEDGRPFRTRAGGTVKLLELLDEAERRALDLVQSKSPELTPAAQREIAHAVGIGSVKYADLSLNRTTDYTFSWDRMLSFDGNTAPYLLYSFVRVRSIFRRGQLGEDAGGGPIMLEADSERALGLKLAHFPDAVEIVARDGLPSLLCSYLYELAEAFMRFYESCPVLKADEPARAGRLRLCLLTARTIGRGLDLLGIQTVDRM
jgi:arginyl-tRNA synthetase